MLAPQHFETDLIQRADLAEAERLEALDRFDVLDTPREAGFDGLVRLLRNIFHVPIGLVSVIDGHRQWFKAAEGFAVEQVPREETICATTIRGNSALVVEDASRDDRFSHLPQVRGEPHIRFYAGVPLMTRDGQAIGTICIADMEPQRLSTEQLEILTDLGRVAMAEFELRQHVATDSLTGLLTRRAFRSEATDAIALARRHEFDISVLAIDLDRFNLINDRFGRPAGDKIIAAVAGTCRRLLRRTDIVGRLGGEEFAVILPHTAARGARDAAEKLRIAIEALVIDIGDELVGVTASFGTATLDEEVEDVETLFARADAAVGAAKLAGRNCCLGWRNEERLANAARRRVLKAGTLHFNQRRSTVDCTVRSISEAGAGFDLSSSYGLPERFSLMIRSDGFDRPCRIVSQTERHVEVEFVGG